MTTAEWQAYQAERYYHGETKMLPLSQRLALQNAGSYYDLLDKNVHAEIDAIVHKVGATRDHDGPDLARRLKKLDEAGADLKKYCTLSFVFKNESSQQITVVENDEEGKENLPPTTSEFVIRSLIN